jgi:hypothetical protein
VTSFEVTVNRDSSVGRGGFGCIYQGDWKGQVCSLSALKVVQIDYLISEVVAVKEMHREDAQIVDREQLKVMLMTLVMFLCLLTRQLSDCMQKLLYGESWRLWQECCNFHRL